MECKHMAAADPEIARAVAQELNRQETNLELIASENTTCLAVMEAQGSVLTNKYAEGYPAKRYYGGCEFVDVAEKLAVERACTLFDAEYANVQPHSGSQANMAVYFALLKPGDPILGMDLAHGGHLSHGSPVSFSGRLFAFYHYGVDRETGYIDYDGVARLAERVRPRLIICGASAYPRIIDFQAFADIARANDARLMVDMAHIAGLVAAGQHPSPVPHADVVTSTTHKTLRGPRGGLILSNSELGARLNKEIFPGIQGGPLMHVVAAKAIAFKLALTDDFKAYQQAVVRNARAMAEALQQDGIQLVTGGTDNHMLLVDLRNLGLTGREVEQALGRAGITANKNSIPFDEQGPAVTSGIRFGTPVLTTRGMGTEEMALIAAWIVRVMRHPTDTTVLEDVRRDVMALCRRFPLYPGANPSDASVGNGNA
ncbi:MAG: serine hydroxymethyltransferase [Desulfobacterales bacterium]